MRMKVRIKSMGSNFIFTMRGVELNWNRTRFRRHIKREINSNCPFINIRGTPVIKIYNSEMKKEVSIWTSL